MPPIYTLRNRSGFGRLRAPNSGNNPQPVYRGHTLQHPYKDVYRGRHRFNHVRNRPSSSLNTQLLSTEPQPHNQQESSTHRGNKSNFKTLLINMIVKDLQPLNTVTRFQHLARSLRPSLQMPLSSFRVQTDLQSLYRQKRQEAQNAVNAASSLVLSAELWSSNETLFYLSVSCHLINKNWMQESYMLDTAHMLNNHTPENVVQQIQRISHEWNITAKVEGVVTNVDGIKSVQMNACQWTHVPCFAHTLNKVFKETLSEADWHLLRKCQRIVAFFHQNNKATESLRKHCSHLKLQSKELTQMTDHWLPALHMLKSVLGQWPAIFQVFAESQKDDLCLNESERKILNNIILVLNSLKEVTDKIGSQGYSPISNIIPMVQKLQEKLRNQVMIENEIAGKLSERCDYHIGSINKNKWFRISTALDPRYKTCVLWESGIEEVKTEIRAQIHANAQAGHNSHYTGNEKLILEKYWKMESISESPFEFWRNKAELKQLASVARRYLTIVSTAIPMERVNQLERSQAINRRNSIEPEKLNMILFLNSNY